MYSANTSISRTSADVPDTVISPRLSTYAVCAMSRARWTKNSKIASTTIGASCFG